MYGFKNTDYKNPGEIYTGPIENLLTGKINADFAEIHQGYTFLHYRRVDTSTGNPSTIFFQIPDSFYFHLDEIRAHWRTGGVQVNGINFEIDHVSRTRDLDQRPVAQRIRSTPAEQQTARYVVKTNDVFFPGDKVQIRITVINEGFQNPEYVDITATGIRIPKDYITQE